MLSSTNINVSSHLAHYWLIVKIFKIIDKHNEIIRWTLHDQQIFTLSKLAHINSPSPCYQAYIGLLHAHQCQLYTNTAIGGTFLLNTRSATTNYCSINLFATNWKQCHNTQQTLQVYPSTCQTLWCSSADCFHSNSNKDSSTHIEFKHCISQFNSEFCVTLIKQVNQRRFCAVLT